MLLLLLLCRCCKQRHRCSCPDRLNNSYHSTTSFNRGCSACSCFSFRSSSRPSVRLSLRDSAASSRAPSAARMHSSSTPPAMSGPCGIMPSGARSIPSRIASAAFRGVESDELAMKATASGWPAWPRLRRRLDRVVVNYSALCARSEYGDPVRRQQCGPENPRISWSI